MKKHQCIILISQPLNSYVVHRIKLKQLLDAGFHVEILELSEFMMPDYPDTDFNMMHDRLVISKIQNRQKFRAAIQRQAPHTVAIDYTNKDAKLRAELNKKGIKIIRLLTGGLPNALPRDLSRSQIFTGALLRLSKIVRQDGVWHLLAKIYEKLITNILLKWKKPSLDIIILGGKQLLRNEAGYIRPDTKIVYSHVDDVDAYKNTNTKNMPVVGAGYLLFIDQNIPYHPDFSSFKGKVNDPAIYYQQLRGFFDRLEDMGYQVVISLHPRDNNDENTEHRFGRRRAIKGFTPELIASSNGVITHCSNALNFAVIGAKPIMIIADREVMNIFFQIDLISNWLKIKPLMIDHPISDEDIQNSLTFNATACDEYRKNYIQCDGDTGNSIHDILIKELRTCFGLVGDLDAS